MEMLQRFTPDMTTSLLKVSLDTFRSWWLFMFWSWDDGLSRRRTVLPRASVIEAWPELLAKNRAEPNAGLATLACRGTSRPLKKDTSVIGSWCTPDPSE